MGDLDDFFAKKDKKKKGTKGFSKANTDILAKNLEEIEKKEQSKQERQGQEAYLPEGSQPSFDLYQQDEEEWADYREKVKDYSLLKIDTVRLVDSVDETEDNNNNNNTEDRTKENSDEKSKGEEDHEEEEEEDKKEKENNASKMEEEGGRSSYIPPHMRSAKQVQSKPNTRRSKAAPDISSEIYFPSLSSSVADSGPRGAWGKKLEL